MQITNIPSGYMQVNTYLVVDETTGKGFVVDPGGYSTRLKNMVLKDNIDIEYIILTHGHGDHIGGIPGHLEDFKNAKIVASETETAMLENPRLNLSRETCGQEISVHTDIKVDEGDTLDVGNMKLKFIMTPGHTEGGMCILVDNCLFSGDTLFQQSIGRTDFPGGSFEQIISSIKNKLFVLPDDTKVFPGHMGHTSIGFEKRNNPFV